MENKNSEKIALGVGYVFVLTPRTSVAYIDLKDTGSKVNVDGNIYTLYKGSTYEESQKVDRFMDSRGLPELEISKYMVEEDFKFYDSKDSEIER